MRLLADAMVVLASEPYNPADYIGDYEEFLRLRREVRDGHGFAN